MAPSETEQSDGDRSGPPTWLDEAFMTEAFKKSGEQDVFVEKIKVRYAVPVGDNFCSRIFRVAAFVQGETAPRSLLVKCPPEGEHFAQMIEKQCFFQREVSMFTDVLPRMYSLLRDSAGGEDVQLLTAECIHNGTQPERFLVLQDLKEQNFYVGDRRKGLTFDQAALALKALGHFHATTHVMLEKEPEVFKIMTNPMEDDGFGTEEQFNDTLNTISTAVGEWSSLYAKKILTLKGRVFNVLPVINRPRPGKFNVLIHSDFWVNNMMFRDNDEGETVEIRFLDFQLCHVGNPAMDLILLHYTSLQEDVFSNNWDELLNIYVESLSKTLQILGEKPITLNEIQESIEEAKYFCIPATLMWLPLIRMVKGKHDVEKVIKEGSSTQLDTYRTPEFTHWMKKFLPEFDERGIFGPV